MAQQIINVGASANDGQGNPIRTSFIKCNDNFSELYARAQVSPPPTLVGSLGDVAGMYAYDSTYFYYCFADYDGSTTIWAQIAEAGNVSTTQLAFGNTTVDILGSNGNVEITIDGVGNIAYFDTTGISIGGNLSVSSNITGANLSSTGDVVATANVTGNNIIALNEISAVGNITGNFILGNGSLLSGLPETYANSNVAAYLPTYTGNLVSLTGPVESTANITGANLITGGAVLATGDISGQNISVSGNVTGAILSTPGNVVGGNILSGGIISTSGNVFGGYFSGNGAGLTGVIAVANVGAATQVANGTSSINVPVADGNIVGNISGTTNVFVLSNIGLQINGIISVSGNTVSGNLLASGRISATGNIHGGNLISTGVVCATGNIITPSSVLATGNISSFGSVIAANVYGTIVTGLGANISGNIVASLISSTGNVVGANLSTNGRVLATGNVTGGNITTGGIMSAVGNIIGQNLLTFGLISASGNITGNNLSVTGNLTTGNVQVTGTANIGQLAITNDAIIGGNLTVNGNTNYTNVETFNVEDPIIGLGRGANNTPLVSDDGKDRGEQLWYYAGSEKSAFIGYENSAGKLLGATDVTITNEIVTVNDYGNVIFGNVEAQGTVSAVGNITGGNINTAGSLSITGNIQSGNITATGNITGGNLRTAGLISATGAITGAAITGTSLTVNAGNVSCGNIVNNNANGVGNIGSSTTYFNTVFAKATSAQYADLAEMYSADNQYAPGTVVMFGGSAEITQCDHDSCSAVVGVVSTQPAYVMNSGLQSQHAVAVALMGRVPCQVQGPVHRGSLMVSAGAGRARAESDPRPGTIIGKAVESFDGDVGTIEILVGRV